MNASSQVYERNSSYSDYAVDLGKVYYRRILEDVRRWGSGNPGRKVLDVGCFDGTLGAELMPDWEVHGLEGNVTACGKAKERGVRAALHDLEKPFPYGDGTFDAVIAAEVIEHVYDTDAFLGEIRRVLKKGGILALSTPNIACLTNRIGMLFGRYPRYAEYRTGGAGHIRIYTAGAIRDQIAQNGFEVLRYAGCNLPCPMHSRWIPAWIKRLAVKGGDYFPTLAGQVLVTAKKS